MQMITFLLLALAIFGTTVQGMTQELRDFALKIHNDYRKNVAGACQMERMRYDMELEKQATEWASKCVFKHEIVEGRGENLAWNTAKDPETDLMTNAAKSWYDEINMYSYGQYSCDSSCHYTQIVWATTNKVGCATKRCSYLVNGHADAWYFVCFYSPAGNMMGENPYKKQCSSPCKEGQTEDADGLCVVEGNEGGTEEETNGEGNEGGAEEETTEPPLTTESASSTEATESHSTAESASLGGTTDTPAPTESEMSTESHSTAESASSGGTTESHSTAESASSGGTTDTPAPTESEMSTDTSAPTEAALSTGSTEEVCEDLHPRCVLWGKEGECTKNPNYMHTNCRRACALCGDECKDVHCSCSEWAADNECIKNPNYMLHYCRLSCNAC